MVEAKPEDFAGLGQLLVNYIPDINVLLDGSKCDITEWEEEKAQCLEADNYGMATYLRPDFVDRAFNVIAIDGQATDFCMGAVGSAVRFVAE